MSPPASTVDEEAGPPVHSSAVPVEESTEAVPTSTSPAPTTTTGFSEPGPTRSKPGCLDKAPVLLRIIAAVFSIIALGVLASNKESFGFRRSSPIRSCTDVDYYDHRDYDYGGSTSSCSVQFYDYFFLTFLLVANAITIALVFATIALSVLYIIWNIRATRYISIAIAVIDVILSYLLISASTSAITGIRIKHDALYNYGVSDTFFTKVYVAVAFSYAAFLVLGLAALLALLRSARRS